MNSSERLPSVADVAAINELIKYVVSLSSQINLNALNSTLVANKAGVSGIGFAVVARELRSFSQRLSSEMGEMTREVFNLVNGISRLSNTQRLFRLLQQAHERCSLRQGSLENPLALRRDYVEQEQQRLGQGTRKLQLALQSAGKRCDLGLIIARSARLEAAHSREYQRALAQVAGDMEHTIAEISATVRTINQKLSK